MINVALKLMNCRVNTTYFVKNLEIVFKYFNENGKQIHCKHEFFVHAKIEFLTFLENKRRIYIYIYIYMVV